MENTDEEFRIKEVAVNKDGTNIWYYPQILVIKRKDTGMLWWKKEIENKRWSNFFKQDDYSFWDSGYVYFRDRDEEEKKIKDIVAFRNKSDAEAFIKKYYVKMEEGVKKHIENNYKEICGLYEGDKTKTHIVKVQP